MKTFRTYLEEGLARREHADNTLHTLKAPNNRTLVFSGNEMVGHIDLLLGTPDIIKNSSDVYVAYINGSYRDSKLKINRPVFRKLGEFSNLEQAMAHLKDSIAKLRK